MKMTMPAGFEQWNAANVHEAIELAERFKAEGRYSFFRGQADASWGVTSTFERADETGRREATKVIMAFEKWVRGAAALVPYLDSDDAIIAAAQHHGVCATTFIDFTREPSIAGWFATHGASINKHGAIFMVHPDEVKEIFRSLSETGKRIGFLEPSVANLWRLEAQGGLFLETQVNLDRIYPLDRIVFQQNGDRPHIAHRRIYPDRRSHLEQSIDHFLLHRTMSENVRTLIADNPRIVHLTIEPSDDKEHLSALSRPRGHPSRPNEAWAQMDSDSPAPLVSLADLSEELDGLTSLISSRHQCTDLAQFVDLRVGTSVPYQRRIDQLWEGMRPHPYRPAQIAVAVQRLFEILPAFESKQLFIGGELERIAAQFVVDPIEIEMGLEGNGSTRAHVSTENLWKCLSKKGRVVLGVEDKPTGDVMAAALTARRGRTVDLFESAGLLEMFAAEIIPWQLAVKRPFVAFWPTHITSLGCP